MSLRLNEDSITTKVFESIPYDLVQLLTSEIHENYLSRLIGFISRYLSPIKTGSTGTPHIHYCLYWTQCLFNTHGHYFKHNSAILLTPFRSLQKSFTRIQEDLTGLCTSNQATLSFLSSNVPQRDIDFGNDTSKTNNDTKKTKDSDLPKIDDEQLQDTNLPGWY